MVLLLNFHLKNGLPLSGLAGFDPSPSTKHWLLDAASLHRLVSTGQVHGVTARGVIGQLDVGTVALDPGIVDFTFDHERVSVFQDLEAGELGEADVLFEGFTESLTERFGFLEFHVGRGDQGEVPAATFAGFDGLDGRSWNTRGDGQGRGTCGCGGLRLGRGLDRGACFGTGRCDCRNVRRR